jgi:hypothetical protein
VAQGKMDLVAKAVELPKEFGVPSGVGAHSLDVIKACEGLGEAMRGLDVRSMDEKDLLH